MSHRAIRARYLLALGLAAAASSGGCERSQAADPCVEAGPVGSNLLQDGFENADLRAWSGVVSYSPALLSVLGDQAHTGAYSLKVVNTYLASGSWQNHVYKLFGAAHPQMNVRLYFLARNLPPVGMRLHVASFFGDGQGDDVQFLSVANAGGTYQLSLFYRDGGVSREATWDIPALVPDVWNAIEMDRSATTPGMAHVWWNGALVIDVTGTFADADSGRLDEIHLATDPRRNGGTDWVQETWIDDVVVAESYIGP